MATIRAYTTIEQSRKLAEILPLESADMYYLYRGKSDEGKLYYSLDCNGYDTDVTDSDIPAWSLAKLMEIIRTKSFNEQSGFFMGKTEPYCVFCGSECQTKVYNEPVDACVEMILKLHELNLL